MIGGSRLAAGKGKIKKLLNFKFEKYRGANGKRNS